MTMLTACTGQAEPTAAAQDETMELATVAIAGEGLPQKETKLTGIHNSVHWLQ